MLNAFLSVVLKQTLTKENTMENTETATEPTEQEQNDALIQMSHAYVEAISMAHGIPIDFDGLSLNILRCPDTHRLMAVVLTPVDKSTLTGKATPRYNVEPSQVMISKPKIATH
jgi:hypothetical protein